MIRVLLVDDEPLVLIGMRSMLDWAALGYELAGTARNGGEALEKIGNCTPTSWCPTSACRCWTGCSWPPACMSSTAGCGVHHADQLREFDYVRPAWAWARWITLSRWT